MGSMRASAGFREGSVKVQRGFIQGSVKQDAIKVQTRFFVADECLEVIRMAWVCTFCVFSERAVRVLCCYNFP